VKSLAIVLVAAIAGLTQMVTNDTSWASEHP
jgi:hypothetical protein